QPTAVGTISNVAHVSTADPELSTTNNDDTETTTVRTESAPVLDPIGNKSAKEGTRLTFTVGATDADSDPLTYSATPLPPGATFDATTRTFSWKPGYAQSGTWGPIAFS